FGLDRLHGGEIWMHGTRVVIDSPSAAIKIGLYLVPENRKLSGLVLDFSVCDNITLADLVRYAKGGLIDRSAEEKAALRQQDRLNIRTASLSAPCGSLSGGNQQKVVLGKWLSMAPHLLILDEPTRGV